MSAGTIYVVDDDDGVRESLEALLAAHGHAVVCCATAADFFDRFDPRAAGCILIDVRMPEMDGLTLLEALGPRRQGVPVVMMTGHADVPMAARAMRAGAADFVEKPFPADVLLASLAGAMVRRPVAECDPALLARFDGLTPREREVMEGMVAGLSNKRIAHALGMSPRTVEVHRGRIMQKTGAGSLAQLVRLAIRAGCVPEDGAADG
jgi:two-component system response regulator FixJ